MNDVDERISVAWTQWPRLYLDAAEIVTIADGKADARIVEQLTRAMWSRCVILVISIEQFQDTLPKSDAGTHDRVADALERFRLRSVVIRSPTDIEPWHDADADIEIAAASNIREVLAVGARHQVLRDLSSAQDAFHRTNLQFQKAQVAVSGVTLTSAERELALQCLVTVVRGWMGINVEEVISYWEAKNNLILSAHVRPALRSQLQPAADLMAELGKDPRLNDVGRMKILTLMRDSFGVDAYISAPGMFLAGRVAACRSRNRTRVPMLSDSVDGAHTMYFPYVDIATCDRQTFSCLEPHLSKITRPRTPTVLRNGHLEDVLRAVCAFPVLCAI